MMIQYHLVYAAWAVWPYSSFSTLKTFNDQPDFAYGTCNKTVQVIPRNFDTVPTYLAVTGTQLLILSLAQHCSR